MTNVGVKLEIDPVITEKLNSENEILWTAAHDDGSGNKINGEAVAYAASYDLNAGAITAGILGLRKLFRNRGKTKEDFAEEKEARRINDTCIAIKALLLEYIQFATNGEINEQSLFFLINRLEEIQEYYESGKLIIPGSGELAEIRRSITAFTAAIADGRSVRYSATAEDDGFRVIRESLIRQQEMIGAGDHPL